MSALAQVPEQVHAMRRGWPQIKHVLKHLYRWSQRWDLVVEGLPSHLRERALQAGCSLIDRVQQGMDRREPVAAPCRQLTQKDHDAFYKPAYMRSVGTAHAQGRVRTLGSGRLFLVDDKGVLVIVTDGSDGRPPRVVTAYRYSIPDPEQQRPQKFVDGATRYWRDKESLARGALSKQGASPDDEEEEP